MLSWPARARRALQRGDYSDEALAPMHRFPALLKEAGIAVTVRTAAAGGGGGGGGGGGLVQNHMLLPAAAGAAEMTPATRVMRFVVLLKHLGTAPWASGRFEANEAVLLQLAAAHMALISHVDRPPPELYRLLGATADANVELTQNVVWITNRQQGKTTLIGMFLAALALSARPCKTLACVYSTKLDRASELVRAAKDYLYWMQSAGKHTMWPVIDLPRDNHHGFAITTTVGCPPSEILARPRNADACRGDAPATAFFDEIAFTSEAFWYTFALPLLQIKDRRFVCTTTPPPPKSFFAIFVQSIRRRNEAGDRFFTLINHALACKQCVEEDVAPECCHRLFLVPPWKALRQFSSLGALMPKKRAAQFAAEVFGVLDTRFDGFLDGKLLEAARTRARVETFTGLPSKTPTVWISIDPPSHTVSAMGMAAAIVSPTGAIVIIGAASVDCSSTEAAQIQAVVVDWVGRLREHPFVGKHSICIPIVECNNNEILSASIVKAVQQHPPCYMPFTKSRFQRHITDRVGVWTTEDTKISALSSAYQALIDGRLTVAATVVVAGRECIDRRARRPEPEAVISQLFDELGQFSYDDKGKVTGKVGDAQDDLGMALIQLLFWRTSVKAADHGVQDN